MHMFNYYLQFCSLSNFIKNGLMAKVSPGSWPHHLVGVDSNIFTDICIWQNFCGGNGFPGWLE